MKGKKGFPKGHKKIGGRKKGVSNYITQLESALQKAAKKHHQSFIERFVEMSYSNTQVAIALSNKVLPDLTKLQGDENNPIPVKYVIEDASKRKSK